jgi:serine phosphatase RsbU (regulator of sigma subunit)
MSDSQSTGKIFDISKQAVVVGADRPVQELLTLFQEDRELLLVGIAGPEGFLSGVSRKALLNLMSRPFALDLYAKKPIQGLLADLSGLQVVMGPTTEVSAAVIELLAVDPALVTDAFPLVDASHCVGVVAVADLMLAVAEEQRRLLEQLDRLSSRIRDEVAKGTKIQQELLPPVQGVCNGVTVAAGITTSSEIGGDFFDYFVIDDHRTGLVVADVSGHGVQSGMVTTAAKASLHTLLAMGIATPAALLSGMNDAILATARQSLLMTCLVACIDTENNTVTIANAGHNFPYLCRGREALPQLVDVQAGFPLGFDRGHRYQEDSLPFEEGDALFMYTDGIVECADAAGEELGYDRLTQLLRYSLKECAGERMHAALLAGAAAFTGSTVFEDDVTTLLAVRHPALER